MADREPVSAEPVVQGVDAVTSWSTAVGLLEQSRATYWLATVRPNGSPHVMPVLAVWVDGGLFLCASATTRKAKNLAHDSRCVVTVEENPLDLVVEGKAVKIRDADTLGRMADAYSSTYDWHVTVRDEAFWFHADGASTAGPPPYDAYEISPTTAFGFGTDDTLVPTRWRFSQRIRRS